MLYILLRRKYAKRIFGFQKPYFLLYSQRARVLLEREREREREKRCIIQLGFNTLNNTTPRNLKFLTRALRQKAERIQKQYYSSHTCR